MKNKKIKIFIIFSVLFLSWVLFRITTNAKDDFINETTVKNCKEESRKFAYNAISISKKISQRDITCVNRSLSEEAKKTIFLTFDDGPSTSNTPKVLEILDKYEVKATFFVITNQLENDEQKKVLKETFEKGHAIANHTHTHNFSKLFPRRTLNLSNFIEEIKKGELELKNILGENFSTRVIRVPGGSMSWKGVDKLKDYANKNDLALVDWTISGGDADTYKKSYNVIFKNATNEENNGTVVLLLHDAATKGETVKALPKIIEHYKNKGYSFGILS